MKTTASSNTPPANAVTVDTDTMSTDTMSTDSVPMDINPPTARNATILPDAVLSSTTYKIARVISNVGSPPVTGLLAVIVSVLVNPTNQQIRWGFLYIAIAVIIPILYVLDLVRRGKVTDFHLSSRKERMKPFFVTLATALIAWGLLRQPTVSRAIQLVAVINIVQTTLLWLITTQWKISIHTTAATGLAVLTSHLVGLTATPLLLFLCVPVIGWSRVYMRRHTLAQVVAGTMLGAVLVYSAIQLHGF